MSSSGLTLPLDWKPWPHQAPVWNARFVHGISRFMEVWHRRAGKDLTGENMMVAEMFERPGLYWHMFPTYAQGKKAIWQGSTNDGRKFLDYIPKERIKKIRNDEMMVVVDTGNGGEAIYQIVGGDQPDRIVGSNPFGVILSEFSLMNPMCWELIRPILTANNGWAYFAFTPRGYNHAHKLYEKVKDNPKWHVSVLDVDHTAKHDGTPVMTKEQVEEQIAEGMAPEMARQEFYVDWSAPMTGAYYGKEMDAADREARIGEVRWEREHPVMTWWDLGIRDTMVIWFVQLIDGWVHVIDYIAESGQGIDYYAKELDKKPYVYSKHYAPHDAGHREVGTGKTVAQTAAALGLRMTVVPRISPETGINAVRLALPKCRFDLAKCEHGLAALRQYRKEYDAKAGVWGKPVHDWASHPADAFRTGAVMLPNMTRKIHHAARYESDMTWSELMGLHDAAVSRRNRAAGGSFTRL